VITDWAKRSFQETTYTNLQCLIGPPGSGEAYRFESFAGYYAYKSHQYGSDMHKLRSKLCVPSIFMFKQPAPGLKRASKDVTTWICLAFHQLQEARSAVQRKRVEDKIGMAPADSTSGNHRRTTSKSWKKEGSADVLAGNQARPIDSIQLLYSWRHFRFVASKRIRRFLRFTRRYGALASELALTLSHPHLTLYKACSGDLAPRIP
jgi:hypothetical protein